MSYSLYLWHWPLIVLLPYAAIRRPACAWRVVAVAIAFPLAYLTRRFVEVPVLAQLPTDG